MRLLLLHNSRGCKKPTRAVGLSSVVGAAITTTSTSSYVAMMFSTMTAVAAFSTVPTSRPKSELSLSPHQLHQQQSVYWHSSLSPLRPIGRQRQRWLATKTDSDDDCGCDAVTSAGDNSIVDEESIGKLLRHTELTNIEGNRVKLGDYMGNTTPGDDATIVVFLRHLA